MAQDTPGEGGRSGFIGRHDTPVSRVEPSDLSFRAPKAMPWSEFYESMVLPYVTADPDFDAAKDITFKLVDADFTPDPDKSLAENGVQHKHTISLMGA